MTTIVSIDPGWSTGIAYGYFTDTEPFTLTNAWQVDGGTVGFVEWHDRDYNLDHDVALIERFTARQPLTRRASHALQVEGAAIALDMIPDEHGSRPDIWYNPEPREGFQYVQPAQQYFSGGTSKADKKKRQHAWLKEYGLYVTGSMVGAPNADDARSAIAHIIGYLRRQNHVPTLRHYFKED